MVRKDGKLPANARVDVDYTSGKPKIKFSYPKLPANKKDKKKGKKWSTVEKDAVSQNIVGTHTLILLLLFTLVGGVLFLNYYEPEDYPTDCVVELDEYHFNGELVYDSVRGADFYCNDNTTHYRTYFSTNDMYGLSPAGFYWGSTDTWMLIWSMFRFFGIVIIIISLFLFTNKLITKWIVNKPWYQKWLPEHNAKKRFKKYWKFTQKDFDKEAGCFVEVPNFKNISIEYKTYGDFSNQLKKIKIREHKYYEYDAKKNQVGELKVEILKWTSRFYFDKIPKDGYMEVVYY